MVNILKQNRKESTIVIKNGTRERLKKLGRKGQTYNEIITKLLDTKKDKVDSLDHGVGVPESSESMSHS